MEVMQHPRVCFTDIPINLLASHGQRYGKYGVGFRREVVIDWAGLPAWYLPNYWGSESLKSVGPALVNGLHGAWDVLRLLQDNAERYIAGEYEAKGIPFSISINYPGRPPMKAGESAEELRQIKSTIYTVLSFIKEMSPRSNEDHSYLFEREWRISIGFGLTGKPEIFHPLTQAEKDRLCAVRPAWRATRQIRDPKIASRYGATAIIDSFRHFRGLPGQGTVAQLIDTILVPDDLEADWARNFLAGHRGYFEATIPNVVAFPID